MPLHDLPLHDLPVDVVSAPVVVVLVDGTDDVARCLRALLPTLPGDVPLLAGGTAKGRAALADLLGPAEATWLGEAGAAAWNAAAGAAPDADLVLLDGRSEVAAGWLDGLQAVAAAVPDAATVTPVSNDAGFLSVPRRNLPWPLLGPGMTVGEAAHRAAEGALALHPRIPTALAHCALVRRHALQLVGPFDAALSPADALADLCARATAAGLGHAVADEVLVAHRGEPGADARAWPGPAGERHPALREAVAEVAEDRHSALARALLSVSVALEPLGVTIDARALAGPVTGTTVHLVELLGALSERHDVRVRALLPAAPAEDAARALAELPRLERLGEPGPGDAVARTHVAHRPWQVESAQEMALLDRLGERTVVTQQDLIGYRTPSAFPTPQRWRDYRAATRAALGLASMVVFFTAEAAADAAADDLVAPERLRVVHLGAGGTRLGAGPPPRPPAALAGRGDRPFLLVLGNRFRHKNVAFALELLARLRAEHNWDGDLVIAGAEVLHGSGTGQDAAWALRHPEHVGAVVELGAVAEPEKAWLLSAAAAVVYPSTYEGFGLIPFEAARAGTPCLVAPVSAMRELVGDEQALLVPWDARASAARAAAVLVPGAPREALVDGLRQAGEGLTWTRTADGLVAAYRDAVALPAPPTAVLTADLGRAEHDYWSVRDGIPEETWRLVAPPAPPVDPPLARDLGAVLAQPAGRRRLLRALSIARRLPARGAG